MMMMKKMMKKKKKKVNKHSTRHRETTELEHYLTEHRTVLSDLWTFSLSFTSLCSILSLRTFSPPCLVLAIIIIIICVCSDSTSLRRPCLLLLVLFVLLLLVFSCRRSSQANPPSPRDPPVSVGSNENLQLIDKEKCAEKGEGKGKGKGKGKR